jgi:anti-anti-sigma factor
MKQLQNMSSEALSAILKHARELRRRNGGIVVINPNDKIADELRISNAVKEIKIFKSYSNARKELLYG